MTKSKLVQFAELTLFGGNFLLLFFLLFEDYLQLPLFFQALGRAHPLVLHFPIVLILLGLFLNSYPFRKELTDQSLFQFAKSYSLLLGAISGLIAALLGLFLAQEEGYSGDSLFWHKWSGAGLVILSSLLYGFRNHPRLDVVKVRVGSAFTALVLIMAGHFGATLTHGEDFLLAPFRPEPQPVALDEALLFDHLILPVLDQKCNSCHNPEKAKGELDMTTARALLKGGKSGPIWTEGDVEKSLLFQRVHLQMDDKKHMPPKGKPQLTDLELELLASWVRSNLPFETRVASLPAVDPVRVLAVNFLSERTSGEQFRFDPADPALIAQLNQAYRSVVPLFEGSPALDVVFFSPSTYTPQALEELQPIAEQVVAINLNKMPVQDQELKTLAGFSNLRRLNLNFSLITGKGLTHLRELNSLSNLSLAGTEVDESGLRELVGSLSSLKSVVVWATPITFEEVEKLRKDFPGISWIYQNPESEADQLQLNLPQLANESTIFKDTMVLNLAHPIREVEIRYTLDGSEPTAENSIRFEKGKTILSKGAFVKAKAFKEGWIPSEVVSLDIYQNRYKPDTVLLLKPMNRVHPASGALTFFDTELGKFNANSPAWANNWAGFRDHPLEVLMEYREGAEVSSVGMRILIESSNVIFPPEEIQIWVGDHPDQLRLVKKMRPSQPTEKGKPAISQVTCSFDPVKCRYLKLIAKPVSKIGAWSERKGGQGLLLVDELFVN